MLSENIIKTVKQTAPILQKEGAKITALFYQKLFADHPQLNHIFNPANQAKGEQQRALADSVIAYACHIDKLEALGPAVNRIANKHASLQVAPEHYPIVGEYLLSAIEEHLELPKDSEILSAWAAAYQALAAIFIDTEAQIYQDNEQKNGGWRGFRSFTIVEIVPQANGVKSFYLKPSDGSAVALWQAGQYVGVKVTPPQSAYTEIRQYSLSNAPNNDIYRITVRAEKAGNNPEGVVSNFLHSLTVGDTLELQPPTGDFVADDSDDNLVLIAGGVGITPVLSMLLQRVQQGRDLSGLTFIFCCQDAEHHIMAAELHALQRKHGFKYFVSYEHTNGADHKGYLNAEVLSQWIDNTDRDAYFCGPKPFMSAINNALQAIGFNESQLHYETFGPKLHLN